MNWLPHPSRKPRGLLVIRGQALVRKFQLRLGLPRLKQIPIAARNDRLQMLNPPLEAIRCLLFRCSREVAIVHLLIQKCTKASRNGFLRVLTRQLPNTLLSPVAAESGQAKYLNCVRYEANAPPKYAPYKP